MLNCPTLSAHVATFEAATERARALLDGLDSETANRQPHPGSWSALQALEHLNVTARLYHARIERALRDAPEGGPPYEGGTLTGRLFIKQLRPDGGAKRLKAPKVFRPPTTALTVVRVGDDFQRAQDEWIRLIGAGEGRDLGRARVRLPLPLPIHMSVAQAFEVHALHVIRHVGQAERALVAVRAGSA